MDIQSVREDPATERQMEQMNHNKPRVGFTHNCYSTKLGKLFQTTCKRGMERAIGIAWPTLLRYRCNGDAKKFREGKKNPDAVFVYDDPLFSLLNKTLKDTAREYLTDADSGRKRTIVTQAIDMIVMLAFEDIYYRPLLKKEIQNVVMAFAKHPELLELNESEAYIDAVFNGFVKDTYSRQGRHKAFIEEVRKQGDKKE